MSEHPHCRPNSAGECSGDCSPDATTKKSQLNIPKENQNTLCSFCKHLFPRVYLSKRRASKAQVPERSCTLPKLLKQAHVALWEGFESSRDGNHMLAHPLEKAQCASQRADHQLTTCVQVLAGCLWLFWEAKRRGAERFPASGKSLTHTMCVGGAAGNKSHSCERVGEDVWQDEVGFLLAVSLRVLFDKEVNPAWAGVKRKVAKGSHFARFLAYIGHCNYFSCISAQLLQSKGCRENAAARDSPTTVTAEGHSRSSLYIALVLIFLGCSPWNTVSLSLLLTPSHHPPHSITFSLFTLTLSHQEVPFISPYLEP